MPTFKSLENELRAMGVATNKLAPLMDDLRNDDPKSYRRVTARQFILTHVAAYADHRHVKGAGFIVSASGNTVWLPKGGFVSDEYGVGEWKEG